MLVSVHMLVCAIKDLSSPSWVNDVKLITAQAVEAILDAAERPMNLSPPNSSELSLLCTLPGPG